jgi:MoaA/NifB/PqqE/SkfB family radical SAM enzyme
MKWDTDKLNVFLDISTYCNAGCPQCHRTNSKGLGKEDWLPLIQWSVEEFKTAFPPEVLENIHRFKFCGTWGDPIMNKDILEIFEYISKQGPLCLISVDTNGSIRDEDFWWKLGCMFGTKLAVVFAIDGINQEMHQTYRRFTDLDKVLDNMHTLAQTDAIVQSQTILFQHNEDYKDKILKLVKEYGSKDHEFVISDRFPTGATRHYTDENGSEFTLTRANQKSLPKGIISGAFKQETIPVKTIDKSDKPVEAPKVKVVMKPQKTLDYNIQCRWALPRNEVVVNPDGQVLPCCFHANHIYGNWPNNQVLNDTAYKYYIENKNEFNVFKTSIIDIMNSEHFTKTLPENIKGDNPNKICVKNCSSRIKTEHQLRERHET